MAAIEVVVVIDLCRVDGPVGMFEGIIDFFMIVACVRQNCKVRLTTELRGSKHYLFPLECTRSSQDRIGNFSRQTKRQKEHKRIR
jgi:hypothetical protein